MMELRYNSECLLAIAVSRNDASDHALQYACHLPTSSSTFCMTKETFLCHNGDSISRCSADCCENIIPDESLIFLLKKFLSDGSPKKLITYICNRTSAVDGKDTNVISAETPHSKGSSKRGNARIETF